MDVTGGSGRQARATWSAGDWDVCAKLIAPVGGVVIDRVGVGPRIRLLDVGTGNGDNLAIPAARLGAEVVGLDITPELLRDAAARAEVAGVDVRWIEGDAQELPFGDAEFDRVTSTFGAMFAPDHRRTAAELVRVCRPGGQIAITTWVEDGFVGELFGLTASFLPPAPPDVQPPALWGSRSHIHEVFGAVDAEPSVLQESVRFRFDSVEDAVDQYAASFGPFVSARAALEPRGRWEPFLVAFRSVVDRFIVVDDSARIDADYFLVVIDR
jgi:ubiquinone/menaquinone biosynthesis C-methylase UbiE